MEVRRVMLGLSNEPPQAIAAYQHADPFVGKTQTIRLLDIFVLGPAMIFVGAAGWIPGAWRLASVIGGVFTIVFNWQNYQRLERAEAALGVSA